MNFSKPIKRKLYSQLIHQLNLQLEDQLYWQLSIQLYSQLQHEHGKTNTK